MDAGVHLAETDGERADAFDVRHAVFVEGQGVDEELEYDGNDDEATHFVAYADGEAIGAARLRQVEPDTGKVERVAVREPYRGDGWGRQLMDAVESEARSQGLSQLRLHAQTRVEAFYERLDYRTVSDVFEEAGIPHVEMVKSISQ